MSSRHSPSIRRLLIGAVLCSPLFALPALADDAAPKSIPSVGMGAPSAAAQPNAGGTITGEGRAEAELTLDVRKFDFAGTKAANRMYIPVGTKLSAEKPAIVKAEPAYKGKVSYATIKLGNGTPSEFAIAIDEPEGAVSSIYPDLNGDGDLTNDGNGEWPTVTPGKDGAGASLSGTFTFKPAWKTADGGNKVGEYALNFYTQQGRESLNYYAASARVGSVVIDGKTYELTLTEADADGLFNKLYDKNKPVVVGEKQSRPVYLFIDGNQYDIRGTFPFGGMNYLATVSDDGSHISLAPTMKVIQPPRPNVERPSMLAAGVEAPDFEALLWTADQTKLDTEKRFKLSDYRGKKIVVIDFWATWCGPCMKGIPHLSKVADAVKDQDVVVIALNTSDDEDAFVRFATGKGKDYKFTLARDPAGRDENGNTIARKLYGVTGIPAQFVIDKSGKIVGTVSGYTEGDTQLEQILKGQGVKIEP